MAIDRAVRDQERASGILTLYILSTSAAVHNMTFLKGMSTVELIYVFRDTHVT